MGAACATTRCGGIATVGSHMRRRRWQRATTLSDHDKRGAGVYPHAGAGALADRRDENDMPLGSVVLLGGRARRDRRSLT